MERGRGIYVVITPATGDMRRLEPEADPEAALVRAVAAAGGDIVARIDRGSITRVWTAPTGEAGERENGDD